MEMTIENMKMEAIFKQRRQLVKSRLENDKAEIDRKASAEKAEIDRKARLEKQGAEIKAQDAIAKIAEEEDKYNACLRAERDARRKAILADLERIHEINEKNGMTEEGGKQ